jgi:hypothetical protein
VWSINDVSRLTRNHNICNCVGTIIMANSVYFLLMFTYFIEISFNDNVNSLFVSYSSKYIKFTLNAFRIFVTCHVKSSKLLEGTLNIVDRNLVLSILINWFFMTPSIATKFQYINSLLFTFFTNYMFRPLRAILR